MSDQLTAIDDALETGTADHHDPLTRELQELALALRADAPEADPAFQRQLRGRVERGFPETGRSRRPFWRRLTTPAFATGLVVLPLVLIAVVAGGSGQSDQSDGGGGGIAAVGGAAENGARGGGDKGAGVAAPALEAPSPALAERDGAQGDQAAGSAPAVVLPPDGGFAPGQRDRKIERSIGLELEMPVDQMARVAEQVTTVTNRHGGFVLSSSVATGESAGGDFELRIPTTRLRPALRDLAALAEVRTQTQTGRDVTRENVTAKDRLQAARAERRSLLRRLENADTDTEAESIRRRLDLNAGEIRGLRGQVRQLRTRTDYAAVSVSLTREGEDSGGSTDGDGLGGAVDDALGSLEDSVEILVRALGVLIPLGLLAAALALGGRGLRRRRREAALT